MYNNSKNETLNVTLRQYYVSHDGNIVGQNRQQLLKKYPQVIADDENNKKIHINLNPKTIKAWFEPVIIDTDFKPKKTKIFGSGLPNVLWSDDQIPTLNKIKGKSRVCDDGFPRTFYAYSQYTNNKDIEYNHHGTEVYFR
jgi:hypothetical protein